MVYEMNKSFVTKVLIMSTVLMAGILLIPTNIQDAKANPCKTQPLQVPAKMVEMVDKLVLLEMVETVEIEETMKLVELVDPQEVLVLVQMVELEQVT